MVEMGRHSRRRFTRKKRALEKGLIGEGFHGKAYRVAYTRDGQSLSDLLANEVIDSIKLQNVDRMEILEDIVDIREFLNFLAKADGVIAKIFKDRFYMTGSTVKHDFEEEIEINRRVIQLYGKEAPQFLTVGPILGFHKEKILGIEVTVKGHPTLYIAFSIMCNNKYKIKGVRFLKEIMESVVLLQEAGYQHNDIKLDNIVECGDRFKLIDWGQAGPIDKLYVGDMIGTSPMKWYLEGAPSYFAQKILDLRAAMVNGGYDKSPAFREQYARIRDELYVVVGETPSRAVLFDRYKRSFDIFMCGMLLLHAIHRYSMSYSRYRGLVEALTSLKEPIIDAKTALRLINKFI